MLNWSTYSQKTKYYYGHIEHKRWAFCIADSAQKIWSVTWSHVCFHCYVTTKNFRVMVTWNELNPCPANPEFIQIMVLNKRDMGNVNGDLEFICFLNVITQWSLSKFQFFSCSSLHCSLVKLIWVYLACNIMNSGYQNQNLLCSCRRYVNSSWYFYVSIQWHGSFALTLLAVLQLCYQLRTSLSYWAQILPISKLSAS